MTVNEKPPFFKSEFEKLKWASLFNRIFLQADKLDAILNFCLTFAKGYRARSFCFIPYTFPYYVTHS